MSGSNKRINQLQAVFDQPPRYGKDFDWTGYSVHDAASVLRRYLNSLPVRSLSRANELSQQETHTLPLSRRILSSRPTCTSTLPPSCVRT